MTITVKLESGGDVVAFLKAQHDEIKVLLEQTVASSGKARAMAFYELRRLLAVHETAEEEVVHPQARQALSDGAAVVDARLREEHDAKHALATLEKMDVDSSEFDRAIRRFQADVVAHAEAEEQEEFARLETELDDDKLLKLRRAAEFAERTAPTRPHPGVESATANLMTGPFVAMLDRARDAIVSGHEGQPQDEEGDRR